MAHDARNLGMLSVPEDHCIRAVVRGGNGIVYPFYIRAGSVDVFYSLCVKQRGLFARNAVSAYEYKSVPRERFQVFIRYYTNAAFPYGADERRIMYRLSETEYLFAELQGVFKHLDRSLYAKAERCMSGDGYFSFQSKEYASS